MIKIFIINMPRSSSRREIMESRLESLGLQGEFIPAIDGMTLDRTALPTGTEPGLSPGEIGCYLSHLRAWSTVVERNLPYAVVLEDDVIIHAEMMRVVDEIIALNVPFDAVRLSALITPVRGVPLVSLSCNRQLVLPYKNPSGTQGCLVSLAGAKRLLEEFSVPKRAIDSSLDRYWNHNLCVPVVSPCLLKEDKEMVSSTTGRLADSYKKTYANHLKRILESKKRKVMVYALAYKFRRFLNSEVDSV